MTVEQKDKFTKTELHFVLNTMGRLALNAEEKDCLGRKLAAKKAKGIPINDQAMAIAISECKKVSESKNTFALTGNDKPLIV